MINGSRWYTSRPCGHAVQHDTKHFWVERTNRRTKGPTDKHETKEKKIERKIERPPDHPSPLRRPLEHRLSAVREIPDKVQLDGKRRQVCVRRGIRL